MKIHANEAKPLKVHESAENYLETILALSLKGSRVRSIDIVNELEYSKPSVSVAMKNLRIQCTKGMSPFPIGLFFWAWTKKRLCKTRVKWNMP
jgi:hypothetical protein